MAAALGGLPFGLDLVIPPGMPERDNRDEIEAAIPEEHRASIAGVRERYGVPDDGKLGERSRFDRSEEMARGPSRSMLRRCCSKSTSPIVTDTSERIDGTIRSSGKPASAHVV